MIYAPESWLPFIFSSTVEPSLTTTLFTCVRPPRYYDHIFWPKRSEVRPRWCDHIAITTRILLPNYGRIITGSTILLYQKRGFHYILVKLHFRWCFPEEPAGRPRKKQFKTLSDWHVARKISVIHHTWFEITRIAKSWTVLKQLRDATTRTLFFILFLL